VKPQFAAALDAICADTALDRLCGTATGSENARNKYQESVSLLKAIDREYQSRLTGPDHGFLLNNAFYLFYCVLGISFHWCIFDLRCSFTIPCHTNS
jgi:hypothetical protein